MVTPAPALAHPQLLTLTLWRLQVQRAVSVPEGGPGRRVCPVSGRQSEQHPSFPRQRVLLGAAAHLQPGLNVALPPQQAAVVVRPGPVLPVLGGRLPVRRGLSAPPGQRASVPLHPAALPHLSLRLQIGNGAEGDHRPPFSPLALRRSVGADPRSGRSAAVAFLLVLEPVLAVTRTCVQAPSP